MLLVTQIVFQGDVQRLRFARFLVWEIVFVNTALVYRHV